MKSISSSPVSRKRILATHALGALWISISLACFTGCSGQHRERRTPQELIEPPKPIIAVVPSGRLGAASSPGEAKLPQSSGATNPAGTSAHSASPTPLVVGGSGTTGFIPMWTPNGATLGNSAMFQAGGSGSGGNVGVGTTTPQAKLDVEAATTTGIQGVTSSTGFFSAAVFGHAIGGSGVTRGVSGISESPAGIGIHGIGGTGGQFETGGGLILKGRGFGHDQFTLDANGNMRLNGGISAGGSGLIQIDAPGIFGGRFTILPNGNIGINNANPIDRLNVIGNDGAGATAIVGKVPASAIPGTGVLGSAGVDGTGVAGSAKAPNGCGSLELCWAIGVSGSASGSASNFGVMGSVSGGGIGVQGTSDSPTGFGVTGTAPNTGVQGIASSNNFFTAGVWGNATATAGFTRGVYGTSSSDTGIGVHGIAATGGQFETGEGNEIIGRGFGHTNFRVDANGKVFADSGFQTGGADFAESFAVSGDRQHYEAGDLLVIDRDGTRKMTLSQHRYSKLVAGIYSTKPGLLGTQHTMFDSNLQQEIPLAVVGVVPCKVSSENGEILTGDLLVSSDTPGYAMRGTDQKRMLGAIVGKALEPLPYGKGIIFVLVTLQ